MTTYRFGDIVLLGFPHTDMQGISKRTAVVVYDSGDRDILLAGVTTQLYTTDSDYKLVDWRRCGPLAQSSIRLGKLATIEWSPIIGRPGAAGPTDIVELKAILGKIFSL